jgi:hypothetical protein
VVLASPISIVQVDAPASPQLYDYCIVSNAGYPSQPVATGETTAAYPRYVSSIAKILKHSNKLAISLVMLLELIRPFSAVAKRPCLIGPGEVCQICKSDQR